MKVEDPELNEEPKMSLDEILEYNQFEIDAKQKDIQKATDAMEALATLEERMDRRNSY